VPHFCRALRKDLYDYFRDPLVSPAFLSKEEDLTYSPHCSVPCFAFFPFSPPPHTQLLAISHTIFPHQFFESVHKFLQIKTFPILFRILPLLHFPPPTPSQPRVNLRTGVLWVDASRRVSFNFPFTPINPPALDKSDIDFLQFWPQVRASVRLISYASPFLHSVLPLIFHLFLYFFFFPPYKKA